MFWFVLRDGTSVSRSLRFRVFLCCVQVNFIVPTYHALVSAYGETWSERLLVMFTAYIDDSGTAPEQKVAMATALVIPAHRIIRFESEWNTFIEKWGIRDFHTSECAVANSKSDYAGWDRPKIDAIFKRVRQIIKKYGVRSYSLSVHKSDYDAVIPAENRPMFGRYHYTYGIHNLLALLDDWACRTGVEHPLEFVFDNMDGKSQKIEKQEIENALSRSEAARPGRFAGRYSFRNRKEVPGLQCVDLIGWTCYRFGLNVHGGPPLTELQSVGQTKQQILNAVMSLKKYDGKAPLQVRPHIRNDG
jgi:hypothetical protein